MAGVFHVLCSPNTVSCYESHPRLPQWFCARMAAGSGQPPSYRQPRSRPMICLGNRMGRKGSSRWGPGDNVGLLSPVGCAFLALSVAEAPGRLNEPFVPHVKRPLGLMSLLLTHPASAPSLFPSVSHSRMTATEALARGLPALPSSLSREADTNGKEPDPLPGNPNTTVAALYLGVLHI